MHDDLRRRALESGKTVSRKAKAKSGQSSPASSRAASAVNSRTASRVQSRDASDDEDGFAGGNLSDDTTQSINSIDALLESDEFNEQTTDVMKEELRTAIDDLLDRKGSSSKSREDSLNTYVKALTAHYLADVLYGRVTELLEAFGKSVKNEVTLRETTLALRAISLTAITYQNEDIYDVVSDILKRTISDSQSLPSKAAAVHSLGVCLSFGGAGEDEILDNLTFLLEIVSSDGAFVDADDSAEVVTAAAETYGFLATQVEDLESESEDAVGALLEQLDSSSVRVQVACGQVIALLFEKSYTPREDDETTSDVEESTENDDDDEEEQQQDERLSASSDEDDQTSSSKGDRTLVKRYNAYHSSPSVLSKTQSLSSLSAKSLSRTDRRLLHSSFASISSTVENPRVGLTSNSTSRMTVRIQKAGEMRLDKWWKLLRLNAIRRLLGGGFVNHYFEGNKAVLECLPMILRGSGGDDFKRSGKPRASDRFRDRRRFVTADVGDIVE